MSLENSCGKILVIDDEFGPRESLRFLFNDKYDIFCADSVDAGVAELKRNPPDVIIMDIKMPGKTGIDGLREIREIDKDVSVVMLTGFGSLETAQEAMRHGANDYVKKPFDASEMREIASRYINKTRLAKGRVNAVKELEDLNRQLKCDLAGKEHLAELGQASSEFIHDINNPLSVISGYVQILSAKLNDSDSIDGINSDTAREYLDRVEKSVLRCQDMAKMWKSLGRQEDLCMEPCAIAEIIKEVTEVSAAIAKDVNGQVILERGPLDCYMNADSLQIYRVIQNLISNAIHAFPEYGGIVKVGWRCSGDKVIIEVRDNGSGIPEDKIGSIFKAYFTTKSGMGGMGIGLYISKKVVESHSGSISIENAPEGGVVARLEFPRLTDLPDS